MVVTVSDTNARVRNSWTRTRLVVLAGDGAQQ